MGCGVGTIPLMYLGLPVGVNMNRIESRKCVVEKMKNKLTT